MSNLYRKSSLEKLSSPEQLDMAITITSPSFWIALVGGIIIIAATLFWGICGRVSQCVDTDGIFYKDADTGEVQAVCYIPVEEGKKVKEGMGIILCPSTVDSEEYGHIIGTVESVSKYAVNRDEIQDRIQKEAYVERFIDQGAVLEIVCNLKEDDSTKSGYAWSDDRGNDVEISEGTVFSASIITGKRAPITFIFPVLTSVLSDEVVNTAK